MLPARHRFSLRKDPDFFSRARRKSTASLLVYYEPAEFFTAAVIISKKIAPLAVDRHLFKRRFQEMIKAHALEKQLTLVVVAKAGVLKLSFLEIESELKQLISLL